MKEYLIKLRDFLENSDYNLLYREMVGETSFLLNPFQLQTIINMNLRNLFGNKKDIIEFFALGNKKTKLLMLEILGADLYYGLSEMQLIKNLDDENCQLDNLILVAYSDIFVFVSKPYFYSGGKSLEDDIYIGFDSYRLTSLIPKKNIKRCLELCSGSGIQSIMASYTAKYVDAVDINGKAVKIARINAILNQRENISFMEGNLYDVLSSSEKYDLILSNPPFIPFVEDIPYPKAGYGGELGLNIIEQIIEKLESYLNTNGQLLLTGEGVRSDEKIFLVDLIKEKLSSGFDVRLYIHIENSIMEHIPRMVNFCKSALKSRDEIKDKLEALFNKNNVKTYFAFSLYIKKIEDGKPTNITVIRFPDSIDTNKRYMFNLNNASIAIEKAPATYIIKQNDVVIADIDEDVYKIINNYKKFTLKDLIVNGVINQEDSNEIANMFMTIRRLKIANIIKEDK